MTYRVLLPQGIASHYAVSMIQLNHSPRGRPFLQGESAPPVSPAKISHLLKLVRKTTSRYHPMPTMKKLMREAIVDMDVTVKIQESPIPVPGPQEVLVKVIFAGVNPKDWKFPSIAETPHNSGDDVSGIVEEVGRDVWEFRKGDRVAGLHAFPEPYGAYAEYAILPAHQMFRLPPNISFAEVLHP